MSDAYNPVFWRENAEQLHSIADELATVLPVLRKYSMDTRSIEARILGLRASAKEDLNWARRIESGEVHE